MPLMPPARRFSKLSLCSDSYRVEISSDLTSEGSSLRAPGPRRPRCVGKYFRPRQRCGDRGECGWRRLHGPSRLADPRRKAVGHDKASSWHRRSCRCDRFAQRIRCFPVVYYTFESHSRSQDSRGQRRLSGRRGGHHGQAICRDGTSRCADRRAKVSIQYFLSSTALLRGRHFAGMNSSLFAISQRRVGAPYG